MERIPDNIRNFVATCLDSVEQLEVLSLLLEHPEKDWTPLSLSQELRSTESSVAKRLSDLVNRKVILAGTHEPYSPETRALAHETLRYYRLHPYRVMDILFSKPANALQSFADAFRFKKEDS